MAVGSLFVRQVPELGVTVNQANNNPVIARLTVDRFPGEDCRSPGEIQKAASQVYELAEGQTFRIGRAENNDLVLHNRKVSRYHAIITVSSFGVVVCDLSSLNGTFVNGARITTPVDLTSGDVLAIAETQVVVRIGQTSSSPDDSLHACTQPTQFTDVMVTVLLADVCGYTRLSQAFPGQDVAQMLDLWFRSVSQIVVSAGGQVDKYIGDCVMALWHGKKSEAPGFTASAVRAGAAIMTETKLLSAAQWKHHHSSPWRCRIALNTGEALIGVLGAAGRRDYTVLGDTVNVAFRLEENADKLQTDFICSQRTAQLAGDAVPMVGLGSIWLEGREEEVEVATLAERVWLDSCVAAPAPVDKGLAAKHAAALEKMHRHPLIAGVLGELGENLPGRYVYHAAAHTERVLDQAVFLALFDGIEGRELELLGIAAAFHDSGFLVDERHHEEESAGKAVEAMHSDGGYTEEEIALVREMILATELVSSTGGRKQRAAAGLAGYLLDADLANIGREDFFVRLEEVRAESGRSWKEELKDALDLLQAHRWNTPAANACYEATKQKNTAVLTRMIERLTL